MLSKDFDEGTPRSIQKKENEKKSRYERQGRNMLIERILTSSEPSEDEKIFRVSISELIK